MAKRKKIMVQIGFEPDDLKYISYHTAKVGNTRQDFVTHAIKKEIKFLRTLEAKAQKRSESKNL